MSGIKIVDLPATASAQLTDLFPITQSGTTYKESNSQLFTLFQANGSALTESNDTNVTLTLGGSASTALLNPASITAGWTGTLSPTRGGTGVNNGTATLTLGGNLSTSGGFVSTFTMTGTTNVTFPTSGTLATTASASGIVSPGLINQLAYYAASGSTVSGVSIVNSAGLTTTSGGVPTWVAYTGTGAPVLANTPTLITPVIGAATGTSLVTSGMITSGLNAGGSAGSFVVWPPTTNKASLVIAATDNSSGNFNTTITNAGTIAQAQVISIPDSGSSTANFVLTKSGGTQNIAGTLTLTNALGATSGGTAQSTYTLGDTLYSSATNTLSKLAGNTTAVKQYLSQTGTGVVSAAPAWATISGGDVTGAALTKTDDTNVTLTLGGSPNTALLNATSITAGWTGQLGLTRGGTAASLTASNGGIFYSTASAGAILSGTATAAQLLMSGSNTAPTWSTSTYPTTNAANTLLYASSANTMAALATANNGVLVTSGGGVPSIGNTVGAGLTMPSITFNTTTEVVGTTTNNSAAAGSVGELISSQVLFGSATNINTTTATNLTSIALTAGDWDVWGNAFIAGSGVLTASYCGISSTSATLPDFSLVSGWNCLVAAGFTQSGLIAPAQRISLSGTTTVYLITEVVFGSGTFSQSGYLAARRRR